MGFRQGSVVKKSPSPLQPSHRVTLSEAKGLSRVAERSFASLRMTGLTLSGDEELSRSFEPCLNKRIWSSRGADHEFYQPNEVRTENVRSCPGRPHTHRGATRTGTRPPHPLHAAPCPYR